MGMINFKKYIPFYKRNLKVAIPIIFTQLGGGLVQFVDNIMVGHLGAVDLAAVAFANSIFIMGFVFALMRLDSALYDTLIVTIFSLYIGYDWSRACSYEPTLDNAIDSACDLYLDIINVFLALLRILNRGRD